ncbi:MAG: 2OG-Fe(II) oxygenase [Caulobacteraceae bacterium]|nr:2OG-Fe(II) oxygenase [Caulobacteraceae bacterium]
MPLTMGYAPAHFSARTHARPDFAFGSLGGRFVLMAFLPEPGPARDFAARALAAGHHLFDDLTWTAFGVIRDAADFERQTPLLPGLRYFHDPEGAIARHFAQEAGPGVTVPQWVLLDPALRILSSWPIDQAEAAFAAIRHHNDVETHAGVPQHAPVLIVPRIFEPDFCRELIEVYRSDGGRVSGVMRDVGGRTIGVVDNFKKRRDATINDEGLKGRIQSMIRARLLPEIARAFMFRATRMERYIVARYDASDGGYFRAHRDNTTLATAHRQFACSINLNAEAFDGGDLRFPEFGRRTYRPPTGGAVIFSCALLHEATPVTRGSRFAFLPFFYDDASAGIREKNQAFLDQSHTAQATEAA